MVTNGLTHCDRVCFFAEFAMITALTGWGDHQGEELRSSAQGGQILNNQIWLEINNQFWLMQYTGFGYLWATIRKKEG
ncbi:hypothetical protein BVH65_14635 [Vibrio cholerae]|nr:hypothetical protein [Vibrio cholerae]MBO1365964.1 hypothetical protein [Vibrio cholerae]MBO1370964.1 hypothetical protein [Vibrio cholerae]MBO1374014.1 hypothetical protein [Vibrio cholerae]MBO1378512.1 hypothetical protein [Vibrio cholerae]